MHPEQDAGGANASWDANKAQLPPVWVDRVDSVEEDVRQIQLKMRELSSLHTKRLMVSFDDASEQHKERGIELLTQVHQVTDRSRENFYISTYLLEEVKYNFHPPCI